jgi:hypothetical protein
MENFKTHIIFTSGDTHVEDTPESKLGDTIQRLLRGPAAIMGMIKEVKIVDITDCVVFLSRNNRVVFPPQPRA